MPADADLPPQPGPLPQGRDGARSLTEGPIGRTLLVFSLPILGGNVLQSLNGSINAIWVGRLLGEQALAATSNANLIMFLLQGLVFGVGMAATIMIGQAVGARDIPRAKRALGAGFGFFLMAAIVISALGFLTTPTLLGWLGTPLDVRPLAESYLRVVFVAMPFMLTTTFLGMALRGFGDARTPFIFMAVAVVLDVGLNPLFIAGVGPFPKLGIAGAATATLCAQAISLGLLLTYIYLRRLSFRLAGPELAYLLPDWTLLRLMVLKGLPMGLQMLVISSSGLIMISMINAYGSETVAAYGVTMQLWTYIQMPAMAMGAAASSMAAQNVGARRWDRVEKIAGAGVLINTGITGTLVLASYLVDRTLLGLFLPGHANAVAIAEHINVLTVWSFIPFGVMFVLFGVVRATGAVTPPLVILAISLFGVRVTTAMLLHPRLGQDAIWWSFPASMVTACALAALYYRFGKWRQAQMDPLTAEEADARAVPVDRAHP